MKIGSFVFIGCMLLMIACLDSGHTVAGVIVAVMAIPTAIASEIMTKGKL